MVDRASASAAGSLSRPSDGESPRPVRLYGFAVPKLELAAFDLDDTLSPSKSQVPGSVLAALTALLDTCQVCVISGGRYEQFDNQLLAHLDVPEERLGRLHLLPTCGTRYYRRDAGQ